MYDKPLGSAQEDINNLLNSTEIATVFVDNHLCLRRFSREATRIVNLLGSNVGRPLEHQATKLEDEDIIQDLKEVLDSLIPVEKEVRTSNGIWYIMRVMPYRSMDNKIQGGVLTFQEIQQQKEYQEQLHRLNFQLQEAWLLVRNIFDMNNTPMTVLDNRGNLVIANTALCNLMGISRENIEYRNIYNLQNLSQHTQLQSKLENALQNGEDFQTGTFRLQDRGKEKTEICIKGHVIFSMQESPYRILLSFLNQKDSCREEKGE